MNRVAIYSLLLLTCISQSTLSQTTQPAMGLSEEGKRLGEESEFIFGGGFDAMKPCRQRLQALAIATQNPITIQQYTDLLTPTVDAYLKVADDRRVRDNSNGKPFLLMYQQSVTRFSNALRAWKLEIQCRDAAERAKVNDRQAADFFKQVADDEAQLRQYLWGDARDWAEMSGARVPNGLRDRLADRKSHDPAGPATRPVEGSH